jgi:hypothetical protein
VLCGAADAVELGAGLERVCTKCGAKNAPAQIELNRLRGQFLTARARAAEADAAAARERAAEEAAALTARCPRCGDDLFTVEFGCSKCGEGKPSFLARNPGVMPAAAFVIPLVLGLGAFALFGKTPHSGPIVNLAFILGGSLFVGLGARVMSKPGNFLMAQSYTDASGHTILGPSHRATPEEGLRFGAIFVVAGLVVIAVGVFFGEIAA